MTSLDYVELEGKTNYLYEFKINWKTFNPHPQSRIDWLYIKLVKPFATNTTFFIRKEPHFSLSYILYILKTFPILSYSHSSVSSLLEINSTQSIPSHFVIQPVNQSVHTTYYSHASWIFSFLIAFFYPSMMMIHYFLLVLLLINCQW